MLYYPNLINTYDIKVISVMRKEIIDDVISDYFKGLRNPFLKALVLFRPFRTKNLISREKF